jgi:TetR/AcrR family transcriptional regulator, transcriptional repressor of bet genes
MPRAVDVPQRRARVAAAARAVLARHGADGTSVRRVAAEAGSSTTVVTHYFADKQALLAAAVEDAYAAVAARMAAHLRGTGSPGTLRAVLLEALPLDAERAAEARVLMAFWSMAVTHPDLRAVQRAGYQEWRDLVARLLADAAARGEIVADDTIDVGEQLMCLVDGLLMQATLEPDRLPPARQVALVDAALARLAPAP